MAENHPEKKESSTRKRSVLYMLVRVVAFLVFHTICPVRYHGKEKLRTSGPFILISNHFSNWDPLINGYVVKPEIVFLGKKELASVPFLGWLFNRLHMIAVDRHNMDMAAMRNCMKAIKNGRVLAIYPEGTRHHSGIMENMESGIAMIALRGAVPVVPMMIATKMRPFHVTHVYIGDEIQTEDLVSAGINKETCQTFMDRIRNAYGEMIRLYETHGSVD